MTAGAAAPPERPSRRTHTDSGDRGSGDGGGKNGVGGGSSTGRDNDLRCRWRSGEGGRDDDDGGRKGERGDGEATARRLQGNDEATRMRRHQLWRRRWQGQRGNRQEFNKYYYLRTNQTFRTHLFCLIST
jgi:hypothetical protein